MYAIDIDKKRFRTPFLALWNHFENRPSIRLNFPQHLRMTHITTIMIFCVKRVLYVYLWWLSLSNFCALISVVPALADLSYNDGKGIGNYIAVLYQVVQSLTLPFNITIYRLTL